MPLRSYEELMAELDGISPEEFRKEYEIRTRLTAAGEKYRRALPSEWPLLKFNWDLRPESRRFALDGKKPHEFAEDYPAGFGLGNVLVADFDQALCHFNRRDDLQDLWDCGFESSLCYILAYLEEGLPITPPLVALTPSNELCFHGGNHRYAAAKFSGLVTIPIYTEPHNMSGIDKLVSVSWVDIRQSPDQIYRRS